MKQLSLGTAELDTFVLFSKSLKVVFEFGIQFSHAVVSSYPYSLRSNALMCTVAIPSYHKIHHILITICCYKYTFILLKINTTTATALKKTVPLHKLVLSKNTE